MAEQAVTSLERNHEMKNRGLFLRYPVRRFGKSDHPLTRLQATGGGDVEPATA